MTDFHLIERYRNRAQARLNSAGLILSKQSEIQFTAGFSVETARSNIGMLIWSAAIDLGSCLILQET